jgi:lysophospholipase L1-like esterase
MTAHETSLPRRQFLSSSLAALGGASLAGCASTEKHSTASAPVKLLNKGDTVLFQGDSITDAGRSREHASEPNSQPALGSGYAWLAASGLLVSEPDAELQVFNRGISGNKVFQLAERWNEDCLFMEPDLLSILIGVNDIWHSRGDNYDGTVEIYERDYHALIERTRTAMPDVQLVICEPFVLRCGAIDDSWFPEFDEYRAAARRVSDQHGATWVGFQAMFDEAIKYAPPEHWAGDGVHPSSAGAALMAQTWLEVVGGA